VSGSLALAVAIPPLFLHATYQPSVAIPLGAADLDVTLADVAIGLVVALAAREALLSGTGALRRARVFLAASGAFALVSMLSLLTPRLRGEDYPFLDSAVSVAKFWWYALLAPAVILLVGRARDLVPLARAVVLWSGAATGWGLLQFAGLVDEFEGRRPGQREPSFVGIHDFAALSGVALTVGLLGLLLADGRPAGRRWTWPAIATGALGIVLSGAMTAVAGLWLAVAGLLLLAWRSGVLRRRAALAAIAVALAVGAGTAMMRADQLTRFAEFLGLRDRVEDTGVESYAHRTLLAYIGVRIFLDHPLTGVGWNGSFYEFAYAPQLDDARRRFPNLPDQAFPAPEHPWGVQNLYIQTGADLGLPGLATLLALAASAFAAGIRGARSSVVPALGLSWVLVAVGIWGGIGLVAGIPLLALTWIGLGLCGVRE
jgi:O-antigen ligase